MKNEFEEFKRTIRADVARGVIIGPHLSDYDIAVLYALNRICEKKSYPCDIPIDEIYNELLTFADANIFD